MLKQRKRIAGAIKRLDEKSVPLNNKLGFLAVVCVELDR